MFNYFVIFFISLLSISLELFFTRILNLKAWNHVVYIVIPFAILGYGIGANIYLIFKDKITEFKSKAVIAAALLLLSVITISSTIALIKLPFCVKDILNLFTNTQYSITILLIGYTVVMAPFVIVGFLVVYLFTRNSILTSKLYFFDLIGAGCGALIFFFLINRTEVFHSIAFLSIFMLLIFLPFVFTKRRWLTAILCLFIGICFAIMPEPSDYKIDKSKGWEWIPGFYKKDQYKMIFSKWHPLGRTDVYRIVDRKAQEDMQGCQKVTFEINVIPSPEFSYATTNFIAGTPIYKLSKDGLKERNSHIELFSRAMEFPYVILNEPNVAVIGTGGGRDIFMAKTHGAKKVIGAEINPAIYSALRPGGELYEYSGRVYSLDGVAVYNIDGRHLVKTLKPNSLDLIVLNGVDTLSGLSTGAYTYAESYLYTKNALVDYLGVLNKGGVINFNRWLFSPMPRETLRLFAIALEALRSVGIKNPWEHVIIGAHGGWSLMLIKKDPFTAEEKFSIKKYFEKHDVPLIFPTENWENGKGDMTYFDLYAQAFIDGAEDKFAGSYPFDISVIDDDKPFFYKYYKLQSFNPFATFKYYKLQFQNPLAIFTHQHTGTVIFMTQFLVLIQAIIFIIFFIILPLGIFKMHGIKNIPKKTLLPFVIFFSCLGLGFMFVEIPIMQRFVLLLGSPIHSISVTLAALLIFSGFGSFLLPYLEKMTRNTSSLLSVISSILVLYLIIIVSLGTRVFDYCMVLSFMWRVVVVSLILLPLGLCLGMFFPSGLKLISKNYSETIAWAWGINCGFTVLGAILAIILGQFYGFNVILLLAALLYFIGMLAFRMMERSLA